MIKSLFHLTAGALVVLSITGCTNRILRPTTEHKSAKSYANQNKKSPPPYQLDGGVGYTMFRETVTLHPTPPVENYLAKHGEAGLIAGLSDRSFAQDPAKHVQQGAQGLNVSTPLPYRDELRICDLFLHHWLRDKSIQLDAMRLPIEERDAIIKLILMILTDDQKISGEFNSEAQHRVGHKGTAG